MSETTNFSSGAVRSTDANHLDFTSLPLIGLLGVARTACEGATKYGRLNYMKGMPVHDLINHVFRHLILFLLGDRSEPHLEHAAWGILTAIQSYNLDPEVSAPHLLGPGATLTDAVRAELDKNKEDLTARRKAGEFDGSGNWKLSELPEVAKILADRRMTLIGEGCQADPLLDSVDLARRLNDSCFKRENDAHRMVTAQPDPNGPAIPCGPPVQQQHAFKSGCLGGDWAPGSANIKVYGTPTRVEEARGIPMPGEGEKWIDFDDGTRAYFRSTSPNLELFRKLANEISI